MEVTYFAIMGRLERSDTTIREKIDVKWFFRWFFIGFHRLNEAIGILISLSPLGRKRSSKGSTALVALDLQMFMGDDSNLPPDDPSVCLSVCFHLKNIYLQVNKTRTWTKTSPLTSKQIIFNCLLLPKTWYCQHKISNRFKR